MVNLNRPALAQAKAEEQSQECSVMAQAEESGESEGQVVTNWIAVESQDKITAPEREQTSARSFGT